MLGQSAITDEVEQTVSSTTISKTAYKKPPKKSAR
jgi:hypothetical protein